MLFETVTPFADKPNERTQTMSTYVDGFVIPVPKKNLALYRRIASKAGKIWKEHGALDYMECVAEDTKAKGFLSFPKLAKTKPNETVIFSWITYKSRKHRDAVNAKVMADPRIHALCDPNDQPFDCKRMAYGGFEAIVKA